MRRTGSLQAALLLSLFGLLMCEAPPALTCTATPLPHGSVRYRLSQPPSSDECETCWEDQNKTVIARDSKFDPELIQNLTHQSIILKGCREFLRYIQDCLGAVEEAQCIVNCSELLLNDVDPQRTVNTTLTCVFGSWCPEPMPVWSVFLVVCVVVTAAVASFASVAWSFCKRVRRGDRKISYTSERQHVKGADPGVGAGQVDVLLG